MAAHHRGQEQGAYRQDQEQGAYRQDLGDQKGAYHRGRAVQGQEPADGGAVQEDQADADAVQDAGDGGDDRQATSRHWANLRRCHRSTTTAPTKGPTSRPQPQYARSGAQQPPFVHTISEKQPQQLQPNL